MAKIGQYFDAASLFVILLTFVFFAAALYFTGLTHDLLLEAGVFLVSVKLILMSYQNTVTTDNLQKELKEIRLLLQQINHKNSNCN